MFNEYESLLSIPDISKWNKSNVKNASHMFNGCESLSSCNINLDWKTSNFDNP